MQELTENYSGEFIEKTDSGTFIIKFVNGKKEGTTKFIDKNNIVISEIEFKNDTIHGITKQYFSNGLLMASISYKNGIKNGEFNVFYENGIKQLKTHYKDDEFEGEFTIFDEFGDKINECYYVRGQKHGKSISYYPKSNGGGISEICEYKNGLLEGEKVMLYSTGEVLSVTPYINGKPQKYTKTYDKNGNIVL